MKKTIALQIRFVLSITLMFCAAGWLVHDGLSMGLANATSKQTFQEVIQDKPVKAMATQPKTIQGKPNRIIVSSLGISLQVIDGKYNQADRTWNLTNDKAQYALMTPQANNKTGNTFIYGHNRKEVFASLHKIKPGTEVTLFTDNGHKFTYRFRTMYETSPTDDSLFHYTGAPILTVQTCSGAWNQNRQLFTFDLVEAV